MDDVANSRLARRLLDAFCISSRATLPDYFIPLSSVEDVIAVAREECQFRM
jgi:hypothetical protein